MFFKQVVRNILFKRRTFPVFSFYGSRWQKLPHCNNFSTLAHSQKIASPLQIIIDHENQYLLKILRPITAELGTVIEQNTAINTEESFNSYLSKDWKTANISDIVKAFKTIQQYCCERTITFADPRFDSLVDGLLNQCEHLTDELLYELLISINKFPVCKAYSDHNWHDIWSCLDDMCCWRMSRWDFDKMLLYANVWYKLKLSKLGGFTYEMLNRLIAKADKLDKDQMLHALFYFNACRKHSIDFDFEDALEGKIYEMNVDELAIVALAYFKTKTKIRRLSIKRTMVNQVMYNASGIHDISLTAIMKILRYSYPTQLLDEINTMLEALKPVFDRFSDQTCLHVALLATGLQTFHSDILRKCSQKLGGNLPNVRLKDIERILHVLTMFDYNPETKPDIFETALEELHKDSRLAEMNLHPRCLVSALHYLSLRNIYSYTLLDRVLDMEYIVINFGKSPKLCPQQLFSLDLSVGIECPDYSGNRLTAPYKRKVAKWVCKWPPSLEAQRVSLRDQLFLCVVKHLVNITGKEEYLRIEHVLPHYSIADIIVCKDLRTGNFVPPEGFERYTLGDVMRPLDQPHLKWYSVMVLNWGHCTERTYKPLGSMIMKQRQLEKIGYTPVMVAYGNADEAFIREKLA